MASDAPPRRLRPDSGDRVVFHRTRRVTIELDVLQSFDGLVLASYWFTSPQRRNGGTPGPGKVDERKEMKRIRQTNLRGAPSLAAPKCYRGYVVKSGDNIHSLTHIVLLNLSLKSLLWLKRLSHQLAMVRCGIH